MIAGKRRILAGLGLMLLLGGCAPTPKPEAQEPGLPVLESAEPSSSYPSLTQLTFADEGEKWILLVPAAYEQIGAGQLTGSQDDYQWQLNLLQNVEAETVMEGLDAFAQRFQDDALYKEVTDTGLIEANNTVLRVISGKMKETPGTFIHLFFAFPRTDTVTVQLILSVDSQDVREETRIVLEAMKECYQWNSIDFDALLPGWTPLPNEWENPDSGGEPSEGEAPLAEDTLTEGEDLGEAEGSDPETETEPDPAS